MDAIAPLWDKLQPMQGLFETPAQKPAYPDDKGRSGSPFTDIFQSAVDAVKETDAEKTQLQYLMATGQLDNPALLTIASAKAQTSVDLLVSLRNKSMEAYNELMRINL